MNNKVFVGNLSFKTDNNGLAAHFASAGTVTKADVLMDKMTGRSKGFGFVEFATEEDAKNAVEKLNQSELDERTIFVDIARPRDPNAAPRGNGGNRRF
jgi:cold-inducible RNA-binding protein